jgi:ferric-dicitrate binding protein FerR (iron transport regulator)
MKLKRDTQYKLLQQTAERLEQDIRDAEKMDDTEVEASYLHVVNAVKANSKRKLVSKIFIYSGAVAAVALVVLVSAFWIKNIQTHNITSATSSSEQVEMCKVIVPQGTRKHLVLSDGTQVYANAGAEIVYAKHFGKNRGISLKGEVYLDVAKNPHKPFVVKTPNFNIRVLGTAFNVSSYANDKKSSVALVRGHVEITTRNNQKVSLYPNQIATVQQTSVSVENSDVSEYTSWINGYLLLKYRPLGDVIDKLEKYYHCNIRCADAIEELSLNGKLKLYPQAEKVIKALCMSMNMKYYKNDDNHYVIENQ